MTIFLAIIGIAIAFVGAWVGYQQMQIARVKLQHDLFDKRFKVYEAARTLLVAATNKDQPTHEDLNTFYGMAADALFLFDDELDEYLHTFGKRIHSYRVRSVILPSLHEGPERNLVEAKYLMDREWLQDEFKVLRERFRPFLHLPKVRAYPKFLDPVVARACRVWQRTFTYPSSDME
jgi:hypothetical protein